MTNCFEERHNENGKWLSDEMATYGNKTNTHSAESEPIILDYIFHMSKNPNIEVSTKSAEIVQLKMNLDEDEANPKTINLSDHEVITSHISIQYNPKAESLTPEDAKIAAAKATELGTTVAMNRDFTVAFEMHTTNFTKYKLYPVNGEVHTGHVDNPADISGIAVSM